MRRVAEMGMVLLICLVAFNSAIIVFGDSIKSGYTPDTAAPLDDDVNKSITTTNDSINSISLTDPAGLIQTPFKLGGAVLNIASQFLRFFFAYNDIITMGLPPTIATFLNMFFNSVIIVVIFVTVLDIAIALRGISIG